MYAPKAQIAQVEAARPMTHTEGVTSGLQCLLANINDSNSRLQETRDRMFGTQPEAASKDGPRPLPNGRVDEIDMMLMACHAAAERNLSLAGELMRRL
jgi:hypothetical protein